MSFGRKGLAPGQAAPAPGGGFGRAVPSGGAAADPLDAGVAGADDLAAKREAFIAAERARGGQSGIAPSAPAEPTSDFDDPLANLRNSSRPAVQPAQPMGAGMGHGSIGASGLSASQEAEIRAAARGMASGGRSRGGGGSGSSEGFVFGDPMSRNVGLAYVLWFILGQFSLHRFYCGQKESALFQMALWFGSLVTIFVFPPIGLLGFVAWFFWIIADLFMIPGMMRRFKEQHDYRGVFG